MASRALEKHLCYCPTINFIHKPLSIPGSAPVPINKPEITAPNKRTRTVNMIKAGIEAIVHFIINMTIDQKGICISVTITFCFSTIILLYLGYV